MATELTLPELGENIDSAQVVKVLVSPGDAVDRDQSVIEVETNKATIEVPASGAGTVQDVLVKEGDEIRVGQSIITLGEASEAAEAPAPESGESGTETASEEEPAKTATPKEKAPPEATPAAAAPSPSPATALPTEEAGPPAQHVPAAPSVRALARDLGVDVNAVPGSGPKGRVSVEDVKAHARKLITEGAGRPAMPAAGTASPAAPPLPNFEAWGPVRRESMSSIRWRTAAHLALCWTQVARVSQFDTADVTELEALRKKYAKRAEKEGGKLTMAVMVVKVAAAALKVFPKFNASIDMQKRETIYKDYVNLGIAVATPRGLLVPVIKDADKKNMVQIAADVTRIARKTRDGSIQLDEMQGGTFTVTNLGGIGGTHFTPIVNYPEVAILGMGRSYTQAGFIDGECVPRTVLPLSLSYDHRLIDGAEGIAFLRWIAEAIEQPLLLSLEG